MVELLGLQFNGNGRSRWETWQGQLSFVRSFVRSGGFLGVGLCCLGRIMRGIVDMQNGAPMDSGGGG